MNSLYTELAKVYEAMYHTFINYKNEYDFYSAFLKRHEKKSLLELGCGTGNLATHFIKAGYQYYGVDLSPSMLNIAQTKLPDGQFFQGDMRTFTFNKTLDALIMTGRTISYLVHNEDIHATFAKAHQNLNPGGIFCFDCINANQFIPAIVKTPEIVHQASHHNINYVREAYWYPHLAQGMDVKWVAKYFTNNNNTLQPIGEETSIVRTFTKNELEIFLSLHHFNIVEIVERPSYAFPTLVFVAQKI